MTITKRLFLLMFALLGLNACLSIDGVPKSASVSYIVQPHANGKLQVQATMSALTLAPNRVRLTGQDHFFVKTSAETKNLHRDDNPLKVLLQGGVYRALIDSQAVVRLGLMDDGQKSFEAVVETLPAIAIKEPGNRSYADVIPIQWNTQGQYDTVRIDLYCVNTRSRPSDVDDLKLQNGVTSDSQPKSQRLGFNLPAKDITQGQSQVKVSRVKALLLGSGFTLGECQPRLQVWRDKPGSFLSPQGLFNGRILDSVMFKDYQNQNFEIAQ